MDLEATSAGSNAKIIQVGIVIVEDGVITQSYETDVNPHERLDEHIKQLTGLTDARLRKAPEFAQVAKEIFELIEDAVFVAIMSNLMPISWQNHCFGKALSS